MFAALTGNVKLLKRVVNNQYIDLSAKDVWGETAYTHALRTHNKECIEILFNVNKPIERELRDLLLPFTLRNGSPTSLLWKSSSSSSSESIATKKLIDFLYGHNIDFTKNDTDLLSAGKLGDIIINFVNKIQLPKDLEGRFKAARIDQSFLRKI